MTVVHPVPLVDAAERARIEQGGLHETLFVEAGAGTGKTHELVHRVVNLVLGGVSLSAIAAITFTEAAGAELRDRLREAFETRLAGDPTEVERAACEQAMADIDQAAIGTLHGFCLRILHEHPLDIELPPRIEILDEVASQIAFQERWAQFVDELYDDPTAEELVLRAWALGIEIDVASRKASLKDVASIFENSWDRLDPLIAQAASAVSSLDAGALVRALGDLRAMRATNLVESDRLLTRILEVDASVSEVLAEPEPIRQLGLLKVRREDWKSSGWGAKGGWSDVKAARASVDAVGAQGAEMFDRVANEVLRQLSIRLARFTRDAAEQRRAEGRLVFHDLLVLARRLLRTSAEARAALHGRYQRLLLDEFQDTDPIQIEVAVLIASAVEAGDVDRPWADVATEPGRLFFVGDPKQSIYRFRRADIALFLKARDRFAADGPVVLRQNFRTVPSVLDWVNHAFGLLMPAEEPGRQPAYQALSAHRTVEAGADHRVVLLGGARDGKAGELRDEEAAAVARTVRSVHTEPERWPVFDEATKQWRRPRWADVTILLPTRTSLRQLEDALDHEEVPYRVAAGSLVFDTQEVREVLDALRAIDDPGDELALVSALRSPLYACSDVDLFTYHRAGGRWDLTQPPDAIPAGHPVTRAMAHLRSLAEGRWWHEPSALLDRLLRERNAFALAFASRRPREVWRRLRFIVDQARAFEESGGGGLRAFLAWADLQRSEGTRVHEPLLAETDDDAVAILTIHGAKGLEFPITVVSGATTKAGVRRPGPQVIWTEHGPEVKLNANTATDNFDRLADLEAEMDVHERRRLLYVACTRARDHLVLSTFHKPGAMAYGEWLTTASAGVEESLCCRLPDAADVNGDVATSQSTSASRRLPDRKGADADLEPGRPNELALDLSSARVAPPADDHAAWLDEREALLDS
ncbi:MAG TPA: UvrD-helicase domain-containing protein, partial [Acidimicrobiales bacterium]|nr:UvrD-helicase domain-containing protein [Acidimicrobiales bacterium]